MRARAEQEPFARAAASRLTGAHEAAGPDQQGFAGADKERLARAEILDLAGAQIGCLRGAREPGLARPEPAPLAGAHLEHLARPGFPHQPRLRSRAEVDRPVALEDALDDRTGLDPGPAALGPPGILDRPPVDDPAPTGGVETVNHHAPGAEDYALAMLCTDHASLALEYDLDLREDTRAGGLPLLAAPGPPPAHPAYGSATHVRLGPLRGGPALAGERVHDPLQIGAGRPGHTGRWCAGRAEESMRIGRERALARLHRHPLHACVRRDRVPGHLGGRGARDLGEVTLATLDADIHVEGRGGSVDADVVVVRRPVDGHVHGPVGVGTVEQAVGRVVDAQDALGIRRADLGARPRDRVVRQLPIDKDPVGIARQRGDAVIAIAPRDMSQDGRLRGLKIDGPGRGGGLNGGEALARHDLPPGPFGSARLWELLCLTRLP